MAGSRETVLKGTAPVVTDVVSELLGSGTAVRLEVTGSSMLPFLRTGDLLTLQPLAESDALRPGDVVAFESRQASLVIHRVLTVRGEKVRTQGDGVSTPDEEVARSQVLGRVVAVERQGRLRNRGVGPGARLLAWPPLRPWLRWSARLARWRARRREALGRRPRRTS